MFWFLRLFDSQNLEAGNIGTLGDKIQSMQLRRREVGKKDWTALIAYPVYDTDHLNFSFVDYFARGRKTKYEYSVNYILKDGTETSLHLCFCYKRILWCSYF